ncbi:MAG: T9SS type A sorting domain-containing protein, partial [Cryomorphaceae bacterium]
CYVSSGQFSPVYISKSVESYDLSFDNCVFKNVSQNPVDFNNPIFFEVTNYDEVTPRTGGVDFTDCRIDYTADIPFLTYFENLGTVDGLGDVTGNFFIVNENAPEFESGTNPENVTITFEDITGTVSEGVEMDFAEDEYLENGGLPMLYTLSRTEEDVFPLAVDIGFSGEAAHGMDYDLHPPFTIIPAGAASANVTVGILDDDQSEGDETVILTIEESPCYSTADNQGETLIVDDNALSASAETEPLNILIYPNPAEDYIQLLSAFTIQRIEVFSLTGRLIKEIYHPSERIDVHDLPSGSYLLRLVGEEKVETLKVGIGF